MIAGPGPGPVTVDTTHRPLSVVSFTADNRSVVLSTKPRRVRVYLWVGASHRCNDDIHKEL